MVLAQASAMIAVLVSTLFIPCTSSDSCRSGAYCSGSGGGALRCNFCGGDVPMHRQTDPNTGAELNWPDAGRNLNDDKVFGGMNTTLVKEVCTNPVDRIGIDTYGNPISYTVAGVESWCQTCVHPIDFTVDTLTQKYMWDEIVAAMTVLDWITLAFAAFIVAFTITGELKDIEICTLATAHAEDKITPAWRIVLALLSGLRRWVFLPSMLSSIPALVLTKGGDSLSICLNTVAILFITDFDNMAYGMQLSLF